MTWMPEPVQSITPSRVCLRVNKFGWMSLCIGSPLLHSLLCGLLAQACRGHHFVRRQYSIDVQDQNKSPVDLSDSKQVIDCYLRIECRRRLDVLRHQIEHLADLVGDDAHQHSINPDDRLDDDDTRPNGHGTFGKPKSRCQIYN